ncbi:MAG: aldo/keto reductase [Deltaproteobacteria bacterium]|nr:aldo/keto reductase [Deltaproteobacteria bacterium]
MEKRPLGTTGLELSVIGLGTWAIGGPGWRYGWGPQDEGESEECIREAIDLGINWIDTAPVYGNGLSETVVGRAIRGSRDKVFIATKCGLLLDVRGEPYGNLGAKSIFAEAERSLRRLQIDAIDLYQIHWPSPAHQIDEAFEALLSLKEQGKIKHAAVCNFSRIQLEKIATQGEVASLQSQYNLINRKVEIDILPWCREQNAGFLAYGPLLMGLLTGKFDSTRAAALDNQDWRKHSSEYFSEPGLSRVLNYVAELQAALNLNERGVPLTAISLQWLIHQPGVTAAIVGARRRGQITECVKALNYLLSSGDLKAATDLEAPKI